VPSIDTLARAYARRRKDPPQLVHPFRQQRIVRGKDGDPMSDDLLSQVGPGFQKAHPLNLAMPIGMSKAGWDKVRMPHPAKVAAGGGFRRSAEDDNPNVGLIPGFGPANRQSVRGRQHDSSVPRWRSSTPIRKAPYRGKRKRTRTD
jgi:hypothetical protein